MNDLRSARPLEGRRVLDFSQNLPGPYATLVLASLGAEVIKIEPPGGDPARSTPRLFEIVNGGKRSVVLDLKDPLVTPIVHRLIETADVLVEGFRPGVMHRLACGSETALELNPRLIYCSISGYGQRGPYRDVPGHDLNYQALTGVCDMHADAAERPHGSALPIADLSSGLTAVTSILAGLLARERDGTGRVVDVAMVDAVMSWAHVWSEGLTPSDARLSAVLRPVQRFLRSASRRAPRPIGSLLEKAVGALNGARTDAVGQWLGRRGPVRRLLRARLHALPHYALYQTRDGRWISIGIVDEAKFWRALCEALGVPGLARLPVAARLVAARPIRRRLAAAFERRTLDEWLRTLDQNEVPVAPVLTVAEALHDPHLRRRRAPDGALHAPFPLARSLGGAPSLGADTETLLAALAPKR